MSNILEENSLIELLQNKTYIIKNFNSTDRKQINSILKNKMEQKLSVYWKYYQVFAEIMDLKFFETSLTFRGERNSYGKVTQIMYWSLATKLSVKFKTQH